MFHQSCIIQAGQMVPLKLTGGGHDLDWDSKQLKDMVLSSNEQCTHETNEKTLLRKLNQPIKQSSLSSFSEALTIS